MLRLIFILTHCCKTINIKKIKYVRFMFIFQKENIYERFKK